jgi:hypothetical protein
MVLAALLVLTQVQTVPANITKVPRGAASVFCNDLGTSGDLPAGVPVQAIFFVDGLRYEPSAPVSAVPYVPHRYQTLRLWIMPPTGTSLVSDTVVSDLEPVCASGTAHAGMRPHLITIPALSVGSYQIMGTMLDTLPSGFLTRIPQSTEPFTATVR